MKTCLNEKIMKISNFIQAVKCIACSQTEILGEITPKISGCEQAMKCSVFPKPKVFRRPNISESRICPNIYRMHRSVD